MRFPSHFTSAVSRAAIILAGISCLQAQAAPADTPAADDVFKYWTNERRRAAMPRDLAIDPRGLAYLRGPGGRLTPYGHDIAAMAKPDGVGNGNGGGGGDTIAPAISNMDPANGATVGSSHRFTADISDESGIKSVTFTVIYPGGNTQSFNPGNVSGTDTWAIDLSGFTDGNWSWYVEAKDGAGKGGNTAISGTVDFVVDTGSGGGDVPDSGDTIINSNWSAGGDVQAAAGRLYFEMPNNSKRKGPWNGYVCSGTVATDSVSGRSVILTAAHCVYDDSNKAFARNVLFIPDQNGTTGTGTDLDCSNDPIGCWAPSFGVVDENWTTRVFPDNIPWDYGFYVVPDAGAHAQGINYSADELDVAAGSLSVSFLGPWHDDGVAGASSDDFTHGLGYSYSDDPNFMYCAEDMTTEGADNWWLASCELSGGSSGGPWVQPMDEATGNGPIMSVNSWGYTDSPGMAGPKLSGTSAECLYQTAQNESGPASTADGDAGIAGSCF